MVEDLGKILGNGIETYTKNLNLSVPFFISLLLSQILDFIIFRWGFAYVLGPNMLSLERAESPEQIAPILFSLITDHLFEIAVMILLYIFISLFFQSFFIAGAIGMAKQAIETGRSDMSAMMEYGKKSVISVYLAQILVGLLLLAGIVFLVPGALVTNMGQSPSIGAGSILLMISGFILWAVYALILSIALAVFIYVLIVENLGPVEGILSGFAFFKKNKFDVFMLWIITIMMMSGLMFGLIFIGAFILPEIILFLLVIFLVVFIVEPLTTVWWVRLYMTRTGKKIYFNELLAHPNDLEKFKANQ